MLSFEAFACLTFPFDSCSSAEDVRSFVVRSRPANYIYLNLLLVVLRPNKNFYIHKENRKSTISYYCPLESNRKKTPSHYINILADRNFVEKPICHWFPIISFCKVFDFDVFFSYFEKKTVTFQEHSVLYPFLQIS